MSASLQQIKEKYLKNRAIEAPIFIDTCSAQVAAIIVIPSYKEENLLDTIRSLMLCEKPSRDIEVLILLNGKESERNSLIQEYASQSSQISLLAPQAPRWMTIRVATRFFPDRVSGVGIARKVLMDEAVRRFVLIKANGLIVNLDADCLVSKNYICEVQGHFANQPSRRAVSIGFKHRNLHERIMDYEIHMRLMRLGMAKAGSKYAFHAVGSSMAVRDLDYCRQGGMNRRKAGEDFYFLHKFSELSQLSSLNKILVFPDSRESDRVPFGTGRAMISENDGAGIQTYSVEIYKNLSELLQFLKKGEASNILELNEVNLDFLNHWNFQDKMTEVRSNVSSQDAFEKRMMRKFNAFQIMKYKNYLRERYFSSLDVLSASRALFLWCGWEHKEDRGEIYDFLLQKDLGL